MSDTMGLVYDDEAAVRFAALHTGVPESVCAAVLRSRDRYLLGMGILPLEAGEALGAASREAIRAPVLGLFPEDMIAARYISPPLERAFIVHDTAQSPDLVASIQKADEAYQRTRGIID